MLPPIQSLIVVFLGGGLGSTLRFLAYWYVTRIGWIGSFPVVTVGVNTVACLILGVVVSLLSESRLSGGAPFNFWTVGLCGGLSTFSTFVYDIVSLLQRSTSPAYGIIALYIALGIVLGVAALLAGMWLGKAL